MTRASELSHYTSVREYVFYVFSDLKKHDFLRLFKNDVSKSRSLQQKFSPQFVKMSSHTSLNDHCDSIPSSRSMIHSVEILASKFLDIMGTYRRL